MSYIAPYMIWTSGQILYAADLNASFNVALQYQIPEPQPVYQGDIMFRGPVAWQNLTPGTSGQVLITNGSNQNPSWSTLPSSIPVAVGQYNGDTIYFNGSVWVRLAGGTAGGFLTTQGSGGAPYWGCPGSNQNILINVNGVPGYATGFQYNPNTQTLVVPGPIQAGGNITTNGEFIGTVASLNYLYTAAPCASAFLVAAANAVESTQSTSPVMVKEIQINIACYSLTVNFDIEQGGYGGFGYGQVYQNGNPIGSSQACNSESWGTTSQTLGPFSAGDMIQLYIWSTAPYYTTVYVRNFQIYGYKVVPPIAGDATVELN